MNGSKRRKIGILVVLVVVIAIGGFFWYRYTTRTEPLVLYGNVDIRETLKW